MSYFCLFVWWLGTGDWSQGQFTTELHCQSFLFFILRQSLAKLLRVLLSCPSLELAILLPRPAKSLQLQVCTTQLRDVLNLITRTGGRKWEEIREINLLTATGWKQQKAVSHFWMYVETLNQNPGWLIRVHCMMLRNEMSTFQPSQKQWNSVNCSLLTSCFPTPVYITNVNSTQTIYEFLPEIFILKMLLALAPSGHVSSCAGPAASSCRTCLRTSSDSG